MKVLIGILSCNRDQSFEQQARDTWLKDTCNYPYVDFKFFIGRECKKCFEDEVPVEAPDHYRGMKRKVQKMLEWCYDRDYDFLFKCDVDTYCHIPRLMKSGFEVFDYVGYGTVPYGGSGYWLSRRAITFLVNEIRGNDQDTRFGQCEDWWVDEILRANGLEPHQDSRYHSLTNEGPNPNNDFITVHQYSEHKLYEKERIISPQERLEQIPKYYRIAKTILED